MTDPIDPNAYPSYEPSPYGYGYPPPFDPAPAPAPARAPASQRRTVLGVVGTLVVSVVAAALLTSWLIYDDPPKRLVLPDSFAGYFLLHNGTSDQVKTTIRSALSASGSAARVIVDIATIAVYGKTEIPSIITIALPTNAVPGPRPGAGERVDDLLDGALPGAARTYPAGPSGGSEKCGQIDISAGLETICGWSDDKTSGILVSVNPPLAATGAAAATVALRAQID